MPEPQAESPESSSATVLEADLVVATGEPVSSWVALNESHQLLAEELTDTQQQMQQMFAILEQAVTLMVEGSKRGGGTDAAIAAGLSQRLLNLHSELKALRTAVESPRVEETITDRVRGLYDALKDELDRSSRERESQLRREVDRLLWILLTAVSLIAGGTLWTLLKPH